MQIEQKPKDYRAQPLSGEPVFLPGAGRRLALWAGVFCFCVGVSVIIDTLFGPAIRSAAKAIAAAIFN